jgi:hypothetical protein
MKRFFDGTDHVNSKTQGGKGHRSGQFKKTRTKEWKKEKEEILFLFFSHTSRFPYSCVLHQSGTPSGYCPIATLPHKNPLLQETPLQLVILPSTPCHPSEQSLVIPGWKENLISNIGNE